MIQFGETLSVLTNASGIDALSNFFYTPTCILQEVTGKLIGVKTVEWVRVSSVGQVQECEPSRFPDWMRVAVALVCLLPATIIYIGLSVFINSYRRYEVLYRLAFLKAEAAVKSETKVRTLISTKFTPFLKSKEWEKVAKLTTVRIEENDIPVELVKKIMYWVLKENHGDLPSLSFVCRQFHFLTKENDLWSELVPLPVSFGESQVRCIVLYKRVVPQIQPIRELFHDLKEFENLPLVEIPIGLSSHMDQSPTYLRVHLARNDVSKVLGHLNYGRFYCMNGLYGLFYKCQTKGDQNNECYLMAYKIKGAWEFSIKNINKTLYPMALVELEPIDSPAEDGLHNFINGQSYTLSCKRLAQTVQVQRTGEHFVNNTDTIMSEEHPLRAH